MIPLEEKKNLEKAIVSTWAIERKNPFDDYLSYKEIHCKEDVISYIELRKENPYLSKLNSKLDNLLRYKDHQLVGSLGLLEGGYHKVLLERAEGNLSAKEKRLHQSWIRDLCSRHGFS